MKKILPSPNHADILASGFPASNTVRHLFKCLWCMSHLDCPLSQQTELRQTPLLFMIFFVRASASSLLASSASSSSSAHPPPPLFFLPFSFFTLSRLLSPP